MPGAQDDLSNNIISSNALCAPDLKKNLLPQVKVGELLRMMTVAIGAREWQEWLE